VRTVRRRSLVAVASVAAVSLFPATRASSQVFLYKFGWGTLFAGLQVALDAIPYVANWLQGDSAEAKAALCKLTLPDISALEYRCLAVAVALDSNGEGPVIPPERGTIGIIPALADFMASPDHATEGVVLQACFNVLGVAESLISEVTKDNWFSAIREAGLKPKMWQSCLSNLSIALRIFGNLWVFIIQNSTLQNMTSQWQSLFPGNCQKCL
jgi:hypothetical protein